ncbi:MAG TPA: histidine phosphatase family protein [Gammaproteobacteria bacterium]|nr:histidine phosphatase family protein [Gammaproteobacteria bacterium]
MTTILIARHGNTFDPGQVAVRIGLRTNLPLSVSGQKQAKNLGHYLKQYKITPVAAYTSHLKRSQETLRIALEEAGLKLTPDIRAMFDEIDYGPDEGKTYEEIIQRIGAKALEDWDTMAVVPQGWIANVDQIVQNWKDFANEVVSKYPNQTVIVVTSNGIARFAPYLTNNFFGFSQNHKIKLATGAFGSLSYHAGNWQIDYWNEVPQAVE